MKIVAIIQARMGSTRLPGKVLKDLGGQTMLGCVINRLRRSQLIDELLVATTDLRSDDPIAAECRRCSVPVSRGDEKDVLDRYLRAAQLSKAEVVVRITADCPLIDPQVTDKVIKGFLDALPDYASNTLERSYPRGLDTEVFSFGALALASKQAHEPYEREHVTPYIYQHPKEFRLLSVRGSDDYSAHRWTVDTPEDLEFLRSVYSKFKPGDFFSGWDVLALLDREPELSMLNRSVVQKDLHAI